MIPVSVITGFLGSGKTTILSHLLAQRALSNTAVIVNEFGDVGLDHELLETSQEDLVTLNTGCLCCRMRGDLGITLSDLMARRLTGTIPKFKRVVIETSGLADPVPILQGLMLDQSIIESFALSRVVTVIDAVSGLSTLLTEPEARRQVAVADQLVLTKRDLSPAEPAGLFDQLLRLNALAPLVEADHGVVDADVVFSDRTNDTRALGILARSNDWSCHIVEEVHDGIATFSLVREAPLSAIALSLFLQALAAHCGPDLLRLKGLVQVAEHPTQPAVIHGVQHVFHPPKWLECWPSGDWRTRMVFIGRGLNEEWVRALLSAIENEVAEFGNDCDNARI
ncbi:MAG: CobW family GTP-binding protein [Hyphomicrobiaceae bacterium]